MDSLTLTQCFLGTTDISYDVDEQSSYLPQEFRSEIRHSVKISIMRRTVQKLLQGLPEIKATHPAPLSFHSDGPSNAAPLDNLLQIPALITGHRSLALSPNDVTALIRVFEFAYTACQPNIWMLCVNELNTAYPETLEEWDDDFRPLRHDPSNASLLLSNAMRFKTLFPCLPAAFYSLIKDPTLVELPPEVLYLFITGKATLWNNYVSYMSTQFLPNQAPQYMGGYSCNMKEAQSQCLMKHAQCIFAWSSLQERVRGLKRFPRKFELGFRGQPYARKPCVGIYRGSVGSTWQTKDNSFPPGEVPKVIPTDLRLSIDPLRDLKEVLDMGWSDDPKLRCGLRGEIEMECGCWARVERIVRGERTRIWNSLRSIFTLSTTD